jgi:ketosteroid isomerase-like protein
MNTRNILWGSLTVIMACCTAPASAAPPSADETAVTAAEQTWLKSQQTNDVAMLAPLLADKVVETTEEGKPLRGKDAVLADAKSYTWSSAAYPELAVTVFDHTAIATGVFVGKGKDAAGKPVDARVRFTDTWVKMAGGKWLCVATQESPVKM